MSKMIIEEHLNSIIEINNNDNGLVVQTPASY